MSRSEIDKWNCVTLQYSLCDRQIYIFGQKKLKLFTEPLSWIWLYNSILHTQCVHNVYISFEHECTVYLDMHIVYSCEHFWTFCTFSLAHLYHYISLRKKKSSTKKIKRFFFFTSCIIIFHIPLYFYQKHLQFFTELTRKICTMYHSMISFLTKVRECHMWRSKVGQGDLFTMLYIIMYA